MQVNKFCDLERKIIDRRHTLRLPLPAPFASRLKRRERTNTHTNPVKYFKATGIEVEKCSLCHAKMRDNSSHKHFFTLLIYFASLIIYLVVLILFRRH